MITSLLKIIISSNSTKEEEYTPKLFSDDQPHEEVEKEDAIQTDSEQSSYLIKIQARMKISKFLHS